MAKKKNKGIGVYGIAPVAGKYALNINGQRVLCYFESGEPFLNALKGKQNGNRDAHTSAFTGTIEIR